MNPAHAHLLTTHIPVFGFLFGLILLVAALVRNSAELKRVSLWFFVISAVAAIPTYLTGAPASELLMRLMPGTSMDSGDQHAEVAILALVAGLVLGAAALCGLAAWRGNRPFPRWFLTGTLVLALITTLLMTWTANLGGRIRHMEIAPRPASAQL